MNENMCTYICMYVLCMYVCMYVCMHAYMHVCHKTDRTKLILQLIHARAWIRVIITHLARNQIPPLTAVNVLDETSATTLGMGALPLHHY
jgi:hypothetical protein